MRVCFVPRNVDGSGWYRCWFPAHYLEARGHFARPPRLGFSRGGKPLELVAGQLPDGWLDIHVDEPWPDADVYVLQMPSEEHSPRRVREIQAAGRRVVVELDDDYLHLPPYNPFARSASSGARPLHRCVRLADAVSVSTPSLKSSYRHLNKNVTVLRNRLFWPMWQDATPVYEQSWRKVRVGYMGILDYHSADLDVIKPWFGGWLREHPEVEFVAAGDTRLHDYLGVPEGQRVSTSYTDFRHHELPDILGVFDVGLVPLARNKFNEGKSYLKGLEYSACGIVPVCTPTQQYRELIRDGVDGFLVDTPRQWRRCLDELIESRAHAHSFGSAARAKASGWTYEHHIAEWEQFYLGVIGDRRLWVEGDGVDAVAAGERVAA